MDTANAEKRQATKKGKITQSNLINLIQLNQLNQPNSTPAAHVLS